MKSSDGDRIPDYVERIGRAADNALAYYAARFRRPRDAKPDIYVKALLREEDLEGLAVADFDAIGGAFVLIDNSFKRREAGGRDLERTVAHELFHLVQYEYVRSYGLPRWVSEGTAEAVATVAVGSRDPLYWNGVVKWLRSVDVSIFDEQFSDCSRCYAGVFWWVNLILEAQGEPVLHDFFTLIRGAQRLPKDTAAYLAIINQVLMTRGYPRLPVFFGNLARELYLSRMGLNIHRQLLPALGLSRTTDVIAGMAINYIQIQVQPEVTTASIGVVMEDTDNLMTAQLFVGRRYDGNEPRAIDFAGFDRLMIPGKKVAWFHVTYQDDWERANGVLIIARTSSASKHYEIVIQAG